MGNITAVLKDDKISEIKYNGVGSQTVPEEVLNNYQDFMNEHGFYKVNLDFDKFNTFMENKLNENKSQAESRELGEKERSIVFGTISLYSGQGFFVLEKIEEEKSDENSEEKKAPSNFNLYISKAYLMKDKYEQLLNLIDTVKVGTTSEVEEKFANVVNSNLVEKFSESGSSNDTKLLLKKFVKVINDSENPEILFSNMLGIILNLILNLAAINVGSRNMNFNNKKSINFILSYLSQVMESKCEGTKINDLLKLGQDFLELMSENSNDELDGFSKENNMKAGELILKFMLDSISSKHCIFKTEDMDFITFDPSLCTKSVEKDCSVKEPECPACEEKECTTCEEKECTASEESSDGGIIFKIGTGVAVLLFIVVIILLLSKGSKPTSTSGF